MKKIFTVLVFFIAIILVFGCSMNKVLEPIRVTIDMNTNESKNVHLSNGEDVTVKVLAVNEISDSLRGAIRESKIDVLINGEKGSIESGNYNLPVKIGNVRVDCPITKGVYKNTSKDRWSLTKDVRLRIWPLDGGLVTPGTFVYPIEQKWFASLSQMGNEPTYVDGGEIVSNKQVYYHSGLDFGGAEGMDEIVSATDGLVVSAKNETLDGYDEFPGDRRKDVIYIIDKRGWYYRYSHLDSIITGVEPGTKVKMGQKIGFIGKQGFSGGWVHLHFEIKYKTNEGKWATEEAYPYVWESYINEYKPKLIAVARPHHYVTTGQKVILDGSKSMSIENKIETYEWNLSNGEVRRGVKQEVEYESPGTYSEVLKVVDSVGNIDSDFSVVIVVDKKNQLIPVPTIHASYHPTFGIKSGDPVTFLVRSFNVDGGSEVWDFGDGSEQVSVKSEMDKSNPSDGEYAKTMHEFKQPGSYIVSVRRINQNGISATSKLHVEVE